MLPIGQNGKKEHLFYSKITGVKMLRSRIYVKDHIKS
jgi:hypothetical protein